MITNLENKAIESPETKTGLRKFRPDEIAKVFRVKPEEVKELEAEHK